MSTMCPVVHFEMPYEDRERMARFYRDSFGWQVQMLGEDMGNYVLAATSESDDCGPRQRGMINGGFFPRRPEGCTHSPRLVIAVEDIRAAIEAVTGAGGEVLGEPMEIPGVGQYAAFTDPEGNHVSMLQPVPRNWHATDREAGQGA